MSTSSGLHSQLASVMESLVLAAVAGLKRLTESAEPGRLDPTGQYVTLQFASIMETLGNEALGKIHNILDKARVQLELDKLKNPQTTQTHVLDILRSSRVEVEHSYGASHQKSDNTQPSQDDHSYGATVRNSDIVPPSQDDLSYKEEEWTEPVFIPAIFVQASCGNINLDAISDKVDHSYGASHGKSNNSQAPQEDHSYGATYTKSDKALLLIQDNQSKKEEESGKPAFVPAISVKDKLGSINLDYITDEVEHSYRKSDKTQPTQDDHSYGATCRKSDKILPTQENDQSEKEEESAAPAFVPDINVKDKGGNIKMDASADRAAAEMSDPVTFSPGTSKSTATPYVLQSVTWKFFRCSICGKAFPCKSNLNAHLHVHTGEKPFKCPICNRTFSQRKSLTAHVRMHTGERPYTCTDCGKAFCLKEQLKGHLHVHTGQKPYTCKVCGRGFTVTQNMSRHMRSHSGKKPYTCTECGRSFTRSMTLRAHMSIHSGIHPFTCSVCGRTFNHRVNLRVHERVHTGERPFTCSLCTKSFRTNAALRVHQRVHTGEKPYTCTVCGRAFSQQSSLVAHMRTHSNEREYICPTCKKAFNSAQSLKLHVRVHSGERPYVCGVCGKTFSQNTHLHTHKQHMHAGGKQFMCERCGKTYADKRTLRAHKCVYA